MAKLFYSPDAKSHFWRNFVFFALIVAAFVFNAVLQDNDVPQDIEPITIEKPINLGVLFDGDSTFVKVKAGEKVKILGINPANTGHPQRLWIEAPDGSRGWVRDADLGTPMVVRKEGGEFSDTVKILTQETFGYLCRFADGTEDEVDFEMVRPTLPEGQEPKYFGESSSFKTIYMTTDKFEKEFIGATFEENEKRYRPALDIVVYKDSVRAKYPIKVIDTETGLNYMPVVTYDKSMRAVSVAAANVDDISDWLFVLLPFTDYIIDCDLFASIINGSFYEVYPIDEHDAEWWDYILVGLLVVGGLLWFYITQMFLVHLLGWLMHFRYVLYPIGNKTLKALIIIIGILSTYVWFVLMLAWGMMWFVTLPMFVCSYIAIKHAIEPLTDRYPPCERCPKCRRIYTMNYFNERYVGEYDTTERESKSEVLDKDKKRWATWTEVTTTYADGHQTKENRNYQSHQSTITTEQVDRYSVDYNVKVYKDLYRCSQCGKIVGYHRKDYNEKSRRHLGSYIRKTEKQDY